MRLMITGNLFAGKIIQAVYWTLIHSLWQGLLLAVLAAVIVTLTKKSKPALRYNFLALVFFLFIVGAGFTFTGQLSDAAETGKTTVVALPAGINMPGNVNNELATAGAEVNVAGGNIVGRLAIYCNTHAAFIVGIWFIIFMIRSIRIFANLDYIHRIRSHKVHSPSGYWILRMQELAKKLQIKTRVVLLESEIVKMPVMVGFLKPVILLPFSMLSQLPAEQVEAILLHELAHIKRKDYFVNLLQHFAEIIFFFNPGILWVSSLIKEERENCCDDIAIGETKDKRQFITALVSFQEFNTVPVEYSLPFPGRKNHLMSRVKRIIYNENKKLNAMEKGMIVFGLAAAILLATVVSSKNTYAQNSEIMPSGIMKNSVDTTPKQQPVPAGREITDEADDEFTNISTTTNDNNKVKARTITATGRQGKTYKLTEINNKLTGVYINGKKIPDNKIPDYQGIINKINREAKIREEKGIEDAMGRREEFEKAALDQSDANKLLQERIAIMQHEQAMMQQQKLMALLGDAQMKPGDTKLGELKATEDKLYQERLMEITDQMRMQQEKLSKLDAGQRRLSQQKMLAMDASQHKLAEEKMQLMQLMQQYQYQHKQQDEARMGSDEMKMNIDKMRQERLMEFIEPVIEDLADENIIRDKNDLSFTLNNDELIVNGVKQPVELHRKMKEKYIRNQKDQFIYTQKNNARSMTIQVY